MIEQRYFWSLGRIFRTMPERFLRIPRRALHFAIRNILLFTKESNPSKWTTICVGIFALDEMLPTWATLIWAKTFAIQRVPDLHAF